MNPTDAATPQETKVCIFKMLPTETNGMLLSMIVGELAGDTPSQGTTMKFPCALGFQPTGKPGEMAVIMNPFCAFARDIDAPVPLNHATIVAAYIPEENIIKQWEQTKMQVRAQKAGISLLPGQGMPNGGGAPRPIR